MRTLVAVIALLLAGAATAQAPAGQAVSLKDAKGKAAGGVTLVRAPKGVLLRVRAAGLTPGWHAIHIHMVGDCSDAAGGFKKSGGHTHAAASPIHGLLNPTATDTGDLPNIWADAEGTANADLFTPVKLDALKDADGSAIVIHAKPDDYMSQPIGGAGDRVACGTIR